MDRRGRMRFATLAGRTCQTWPCIFFVSVSVVALIGGGAPMGLVPLDAAVAAIGVVATVRGALFTGLEIRND